MRPEYVDVSDKVRYIDLSPCGKRAVFGARGDIFTVPADKGNTVNLTKTSGANEREPQWSPDGKWIAYISDESGEEELYLVKPDGAEKTRMTTDGYCHKYDPAWSPDSRKLIFSDKELDVFLVDIETKAVKKIDSPTRSETRSFSWSPDSRYVAYGKTLENRISAIFMYCLDDGKIRQVTPGFTNDYAPEFDPDGKYLYFLSERTFNPILSSYEFEFVNNAITNLYLLVLDANEKSPFTPLEDDDSGEEESVGKGEDRDREHERDRDKDHKKDKDKDAGKEVSPVRIDFDGIYDRQVAFDLPSGNYRGIDAVSGAVFYTTGPIRGLAGRVTQDKPSLHKYDIKKEKDHVFAEGVSTYSIAADGEKMIIGKNGGYHIVDVVGPKASFDDNSVDLSQMEMRVDRRAEYVQMFEDTWRMERDFFYDANLHGVDWQKMHDRYAPLLPYCQDRGDLNYVLGEMVGELCCSHTYVGGGDRVKIDGSEIGLLGVDFEIDHANSRVRFARILRGENWDKKLRSPLTEPGVDIREGDYLLAINGEEITAAVNPYRLTENSVDRIITLTVNDKPSLNGAREVEVKPIASEESLRYYNWVEDRRLYVDSVSGGEIGYIHIPDMDSYGLVRFAKMYYHQFRKPGLIIDVRYNGGGFVSGLILERLRREIVCMGASRTFANGPSPGGGIRAHMVTLLNEFSCSDGDYFPFFFREYDLGPLMGKRSWGGVIGIRGYRPLMDGGYYTAPEFSIYSLDGEWLMENEGVHPDIEVDNLPDRIARGYDDQLDKAIEYVTEKMKTEPRPLPPVPAPPTPR